MANFLFPEPEQFREIENVAANTAGQTLNGVLADPIFQFMPIQLQNSSILKLAEDGIMGGLQNVRGYDMDPRGVARPSARQTIFRPAIYGDSARISEQELTERGQLSGAAPLNVTDLVTRLANGLAVRRANRIRWACWQLVTFGSCIVRGPEGEAYEFEAPINTGQAATDWSDQANSTPLADLRAQVLQWRNLAGVSFGAGAIAYVSQKTAFDILGNRNANDLGGKRVVNGSTLTALSDVNRFLVDAGLPEFRVWDAPYVAEAPDAQGRAVNAFMVPDDRVILFANIGVARRGSYQMTRLADNPNGGPGPWTGVKEQNAPKRITVVDLHNGGPVIDYPSTVLSLGV